MKGTFIAGIEIRHPVDGVSPDYVCIHCLEGLTFRDGELVESGDTSRLLNECRRCSRTLLSVVSSVNLVQL